MGVMEMGVTGMGALESGSEECEGEARCVGKDGVGGQG